MCSSWYIIHCELQQVHQILLNNGYSNTEFDSVTNIMLEQQLAGQNWSQTNDLTVFYQNTFTNSYNKHEKVVKDILKRNCKPTNENVKLRNVVYRKNQRTGSLVMRNNSTVHSGTLSRARVVYEYDRTTGDCAPHNTTYIGRTTCSLRRRLSSHLQEGAIKQHRQYHEIETEMEITVNNRSTL